MTAKPSTTAAEREPPDLDRCQTMRPSTWPEMPTPFTLGPVSFSRCTNDPAWLASDGSGSMSLCEECKPVCEAAFAKSAKGVTFVRMARADRRSGHDRRRS